MGKASIDKGSRVEREIATKLTAKVYTSAVDIHVSLGPTIVTAYPVVAAPYMLGLRW